MARRSQMGGRLLNEARVMIRDKTLDRALDRLRKPDARPDGVRIADETAQRLLEHPRIQPDSSGLLPGHPQSWRLGDWRSWKR
jgi:hypothetical protein